MMSLQKQEEVCGICLAVLCGFCGLISAFLLGGVGICGFELKSGMVCFALGLAAVLPAVTVRFLSAKWWVTPIAFCHSLWLPMAAGILDQEWARFFSALGCIAAAITSAWVFRRRPNAMNAVSLP